MVRAGVLLTLAGLLVGVLVTLLGVPRADQQIVDALRPLRDGAYGELFRFMTHAGSFWWMVVMGGVLGVAAMLLGRPLTAGALLLVSAPVTTLVTLGLKIPFDRPRPERNELLHATGLSMPSGHATGAAALAVAVLVVVRASMDGRRRWRWPVAVVGAMSFALLVGMSRPVLGVHYPTDVLAGWLIGAGLTLLLARVLIAPPPHARSARRG